MNIDIIVRVRQILLDEPIKEVLFEKHILTLCLWKLGGTCVKTYVNERTQ